MAENDGSLSWEGGVNSLKPATVQSEAMPNGLPRNQLAWLVNGTVRGGGIQPRFGWQYVTTVNPGDGLFQGGIIYEPPGDTSYLVMAVGGRIYKVNVATNNGVLEISTPTTRDPAAQPKFYFVQAEQFLIIQAGDNVTLPLFWDGATMRRSLGVTSTAIYRASITTAGWVTPAVGSSVTVALDVAYGGSVGDTVVWPGNLAHVGPVVASWSTSLATFQVTAIAGLNVTLLVKSTSSAGTFNGPNVPLIQLLSAELPAATCMSYYMDRVWYAQGRNYIAGDIVKGPSGTAAYNYRDSVLKVTENPLAIGGDGFTVPADAGNIRALTYTSELDTTLGQGKLYIGSAKAFYRLAVPVSRSDWIGASDSSQPLQTIAQIKYGPVNDRSVTRVNGDLFYQTIEPAIRTLFLAIRYFKQWANVPISRNIERALNFNDRSLMEYVSGVEFDNRMLQAILPVQTPVGVACQAIASLDFDLISTLEEQLPPSWEGIWEGLQILQLFEGDFGGRQRCFAAVRSATDGSIQVWELTDYLKTDVNQFGESRITWVVEFPAFTDGVEFLLKRLTGGELWVDRISGKVDFTLEFRPDGDACWHFWSRWQVCAARNSCENVVDPICYPVTPYAEGYKQTWSLPKPPADCASFAGRPTEIGHQFQARLTVTGWCRIRGFVMTVQRFDQKQYHDNACLMPAAVPARLNPQLNTPEVPTPNIPYIGTDNGTDPVLGPPYAPVNYQLFANSSAPRLNWTVPDVLIEASQTAVGNNTVVVALTSYTSVPAGTVFKIYWYQGGRASANIKLLAGSDGTHGPGYGVIFTVVFNATPPTFTVHFSPIEEAPFDLILFVTATANGSTIYSQTIPFTVQ